MRRFQLQNVFLFICFVILFSHFPQVPLATASLGETPSSSSFSSSSSTSSISPSSTTDTSKKRDFSQRGGILRNADHFYRHADKQLIILEGHVELMSEGEVLHCDRASVYEASQVVDAEGHVVLDMSGLHVEGDRARIDYKQGTATVYNGLVESGPVTFQGQKIFRLSEDEWAAETGYYTACMTCPPAWSMSGSHIHAQIGGYAQIRNAILEIAHFPVLWIPYLIVPLKSNRQTGFLIPTLDFSGKGGTAIEDSFFWAISPSQDATFSAKNYSFRGVKATANYRYLLSPTSSGNMTTGLIQDRVFSGDKQRYQLNHLPHRNPRFKRWFIDFHNYYDLPGGFIQRSDVDLVSDLLYPMDFPEDIGGYGAPSIETRMSLTRNWPNQHSSLDVSHYRNTLKIDAISENEDSVHRFPEFRYSLIDLPLFNHLAFFRTDFNYVNFARSHYAYDDVGFADNIKTVDTSWGKSGNFESLHVGNAHFDPGVDVIRTGQRFIFEPQLSMPFQLWNTVKVLPILSFRHTQYALGITPGPNEDINITPSQDYLQGRIAFRSRLTGIYENELHQATLRHEIEPEITLSTLPWFQQSEKSYFFGQSQKYPSFIQAQPVSDDDFRSDRGIQFDYEDRVPQQNLVTFALTNRWVQKKTTQNSSGLYSSSYNRVAQLKLMQSYDFDEARRDYSRPHFPWSDITAILDLGFPAIDSHIEAHYFPYHNVTNTSSRIRLINSEKDYIELRLDQNYLITQNPQAAYSSRSENLGFGIGLNGKYLRWEAGFDTRPKQYDPIVLEVKSWNSKLIMIPPGGCWTLQAQVQQLIGNEATFKFTFDFLFGGDSNNMPTIAGIGRH